MEGYFCQVCYSQISDPAELDDSYSLTSCGHRFCRECLVSFLESSINNGSVSFKCFYLSPTAEPSDTAGTAGTLGSSGDLPSAPSSSPEEEEKGKRETDKLVSPDDLTNEIWTPHDASKHVKCNTAIPREEVVALLETHTASASIPTKTVSLLTFAEDAKGVKPAVRIDYNDTKGALILDRLRRFEFLKSSKFARECPACSLCQECTEERRGKQCLYLEEEQKKNEVTPNWRKELYSHNSNNHEEGEVTAADGDSSDPKMNADDVMCENPRCNHVFCYQHSDAHKGKTCEQYRLDNAVADEQSTTLIDSTTRKCPGCGIPVSKIEGGGCNHMKCPDCGCAFCWLCGKEIEDTTFPSHFAYWNMSSRCSNMQMDGNAEMSDEARLGAGCTTMVELVVLGPLALISSLVSLLLCCCLVPVLLRTQVDRLQYGEREEIINVQTAGDGDGNSHNGSKSNHEYASADTNDRDTNADDLENGNAGGKHAAEVESAVGVKAGAEAEALSKPSEEGGGDEEPELAAAAMLGTESSAPAGAGVGASPPQQDSFDNGTLSDLPRPVHAPPYSWRAVELLMGNCMNGWSMFWGTLLMGAPMVVIVTVGAALYLAVWIVWNGLLGLFVVLPLSAFREAKKAWLGEDADADADANANADADADADVSGIEEGGEEGGGVSAVDLSIEMDARPAEGVEVV
jgi:hypothetical protein